NGNLDNLDGALTVNGGAGVDALNINDQNNPFNDTFTIAATSVDRPFAAPITYGTVENVTVNAGAGDNTFAVLATPAASMTLNAGAGNDTIDYSAFATGVVVDLTAGAATGFAAISGFENATGGAGNDILVGNALVNILEGNAGDDALFGL